jgi:2-polyprenyl-3-methyl-5-hydroxy-6-metoxy-1,4-benzoquinol methylase
VASCPRAAKCYWYHTMQFPDGTRVKASWTIPDFANYIGGYDLAGKTVLDVGRASGYLAFEAERAGAIVTGLDAQTTRTTREFRHVPFADAISF